MTEIDLYYSVEYIEIPHEDREGDTREILPEAVTPKTHTRVTLYVTGHGEKLITKQVVANFKAEGVHLTRIKKTLWDWLDSWIHQLYVHVIHDRSRNGFPRVKDVNHKPLKMEWTKKYESPETSVETTVEKDNDNEAGEDAGSL